MAQSTDFPIVNALYPTCIPRKDIGQCYDIFITKLNTTGTGLLYSTFLAPGYGQSVATNLDGEAFITGSAFAQGFPTVHALYPTTTRSGEAFITRVNATGSALLYSTFLGDAVDDDAFSIAVDKDSNAYVVGATTDNFPVVNAIQSKFAGGMRDAFVTKIDASGSALLYSTYLGGSDDDAASSVAVDSDGNAYVVGSTLSQDFPVQNALQPQFDPDFPGYYSFIAKIANSTNFSITDTVDRTVVSPGGDLHYTITVTNIGSDAASGVVQVTSLRDRFRTCTVSNGYPCRFVVLGGRASVDVSSLAGGSSRTILIYATAAETAGDENSITNTAAISGISASATATVRETADVGISSSLIDNTNGVLHYVHTVSNLGPDNAHAVVLLDPLPDHTTFISASTSVGSCSFHPTLGAHGSVRCTLDNPNAGSSVEVDVTLQGFAASCPAVTNTVAISSQSIDPNGTNDSATLVSPLPASVCSPPAPPSQLFLQTSRKAPVRP